MEFIHKTNTIVIVFFTLLPTAFLICGLISNYLNIKRRRKEWSEWSSFAKPKWIEIFSTNSVYGNASMLGAVCMGYFYCFIAAYAFLSVVFFITYLIEG